MKLLVCGLVIKLQLAIILCWADHRSPINTSAAWTIINGDSLHCTLCFCVLTVQLEKYADSQQNTKGDRKKSFELKRRVSLVINSSVNK